MLPDTRRRYAVILALVTGFCLVFNLVEQDDSLVRRRAEALPITVIPTSNDAKTVQEKRPVMHTFYDPSGTGYCCGMLEVRNIAQPYHRNASIIIYHFLFIHHTFSFTRMVIKDYFAHGKIHGKIRDGTQSS